MLQVIPEDQSQKSYPVQQSVVSEASANVGEEEQAARGVILPNKQQQLNYKYFGIVALLIIVAGVIVVTVLTTNKNSTNNLRAAAQPSAAPTNFWDTAVIGIEAQETLDQILNKLSNPQIQDHIENTRQYLYTQDLLLEEKLEDSQRFTERVILTLFSLSSGVNIHLPAKDYCTWQGISCNEELYVTVIRINKEASMTGVLPPFHDLLFLQEIDLAENSLQGTIPTLPQEGQLFYCDFSYNNFTGPLPDSFAPSLEFLYLDHNQLTGTIFPSSQYQKLRDCWLDHNELTGPIPKVSDSLYTLHISHNHLNGTLPETLSPMLRFLDVSRNQFTGTLPSSYLEHSTLENLFVDENNLSGALPSVNGTSQLKALFLYNNQFNGTYPDDFGSNLPELQELLLHDNEFEPSTLESCDQWPDLKVLQVDCAISCNCCTSDCID